MEGYGRVVTGRDGATMVTWESVGRPSTRGGTTGPVYGGDRVHEPCLWTPTEGKGFGVHIK